MQPMWTQEQAVAFECAREAISDLMAICSAAIASEEASAPEGPRLAELEQELAGLARERADLRVADHDRIAAIRRTYGERVRVYRAQQQAQHQDAAAQ